MAPTSNARAEMRRNMAASSLCIATAVVVFNPLDCLRIRWQVAPKTQTARGSSGMWGFTRAILRTEGLWKGLWWPGIGSNAVGAAWCRGIGMGCYPTVRDWLLSVRGVDPNQKDGATMFVAGLLSGGVGYGISTPAWMLKTRLQASAGKVPPLYKNGMVGALEIARTEGAATLYRGASALVLRGALMNAGNTLGYDMTKTQARRHQWQEGPALHLMASLVAAFMSCTLSCPADLVMTKYQVANASGCKESVLTFAATMLKVEGPMALYRGWTALFMRVAPLYIIYLPAYEQVRVRVFGLGYMT